MFPRCHLSVMRPPGTFPGNSEHHRSTKLAGALLDDGLFFNFSYEDLPSLATWHWFRRSVPCSAIHGNTGEWTETRLPILLERSKRITLVISSNDLIPRSMTPFDCESATGECSNSVQCDPSKIRDFPQDIHDCKFLIRSQCHLTTVSQSFQTSSALLDHPLNHSFHWYHLS